MSDASILDIDSLLVSVSEEEPCGPNLEYDPAFLELEQTSAGKPEVQYGSTITPAVPPDWKRVSALAQELLARSRDLRVAVWVARALLNTRALPGFTAGLELIERLLDQRWDTLHPQLDPSDNNDPLLRINSIAALAQADAMLQELREAPLLMSRAGQFNLRHIDIATGELDVPNKEESPTLAIIDAACMDLGLDELQAVCTYLSQARDHSVRIEALLTAKVGAAQAIDLSALTKMLARAYGFVAERLQRRQPDAAVSGDTQSANASSNAAAGGSNVSSREDVVRLLDVLCSYYDRHEPSSPIPLLLQRAKRLVPKNFVELLEDMAPEGLGQIYSIGGIKKE